MAGYAAEMVHDGDCIQLGFGGIPNAIGFELMNRHDLGIHTEQIGASMARMIQQGVVTNRYKNLDKGWSVGAFIIADNFTYEYLNNHPPGDDAPGPVHQRSYDHRPAGQHGVHQRRPAD